MMYLKYEQSHQFAVNNAPTNHVFDRIDFIDPFFYLFKFYVLHYDYYYPKQLYTLYESRENPNKH